VIVAGSAGLLAHTTFLGEMAIRCELTRDALSGAMWKALDQPFQGARPQVEANFASVLLDSTLQPSSGQSVPSA
jgi:hypothetical protein